MILRRLSRYVAEQNWIAVAIEFVLIVLGIYLGLWLGNLNEDRQDRELYSEAFGRVVVELENNLAGIEADQGAIRERLPVVQQALEDLRACRTGPEAEANVQAALAPIQWEIEFILDTHALDQLIANEAFLPYQDAATRETLMEVISHIDQMQRYSIEINDELESDPLSTLHIAEPGELSYASPDDLIAAFERGEVEGGSMWRDTKLIAPLEVACRENAFLMEFYSWEVSAYWHTVAAHSLADTIRVGLETLQGENAGTRVSGRA